MKRYAILLGLVVSLLLVQAAAADLVVNGGFETGSFSGWTQGGNKGFTGIDTAVRSGTYAAFFGPVGSDGTLSQNLGTTIGAKYQLTFWLANSGGTPNDFSVSFGGGTPLLQLTNAIPPQGYTQYTYYGLVAPSATTSLVFSFRQDPGYWHLDDISVNAVPIPGAVWLLGSGLVGLAGLRRKFKS